MYLKLMHEFANVMCGTVCGRRTLLRKRKRRERESTDANNNSGK